jgi:hypothetical protein
VSALCDFTVLFRVPEYQYEVVFLGEPENDEVMFDW